ncbi:probable xyloglucan endotransglucosylase/hydrolase protein 33 isoform X2 [Zingiber officinale]|uniref:probable xyloglucan endotransglucosylase/hydrolase protein 33 isoform X2 n=1 Tax=Zingiber officinale TaxID=94328 RepID=UPI001C4B1112|nr:probable xyloglucan endotransglucosylase/hydrolase protein 33 isoform X2 [Zingiber officinale]
MLSITHTALYVAFSLISLVTVASSMRHNSPIPPPTTSLTDRFPHLGFDAAFTYLFGGKNIKKINDGSCVSITLDNSSGCGFKSKEIYYYGFFSAAIKLPSDYSAGVVVAFYVSNSQVYPHNHDEIDFEFLGHEKRKDWALQTNIYGNGSTMTGREEKFYLWFDPTIDFHEFLVDNIPVREVSHNEAMSRAYPSKPMSVYATIWDGSDWATHGGKKPVNYKVGPFVAWFKDLEMAGCAWNQTSPAASCSKRGSLSRDPVEGNEFMKLSEQQQRGMQWARSKFMFYSYCNDLKRFPVLPMECRGGKV